MKKIIDGNTGASLIAYKCSDLAFIYPITPSSTMAENCDEWCSKGELNAFNKPMQVIEMQSEAGAAGALHGALNGGALATTFTASQGLLLMIPNMYKIAGELLPCVIHVSARTIATHALNIFGDHSDVMACRSTGFAMLCASSVQEAHDFALISHISTLKSHVPFLHFFDGFRTSHELQAVDIISDDIIDKLLPYDDISDFKKRALTPNHPTQCGTAQNPDIFFQNREACSKYYAATASIVQNQMNELAAATGRKYHLFDYVGHSSANHIIVMMGSGAEAVEEYILNNPNAEIGLVKVRLFKPFSINHFVSVLPKSVKCITVLDRVKDSASIGEPLYEDVITALFESGLNVKVLGGRYGIGGKDFTPAQVHAIYKNMETTNKNHFTVGITDDVSHSSLEIEKYLPKNKFYEMKFFGLGSDGTVSANKNSIKIIGESTNKYVQGYFEYDSKKSGSLTISHLRISDNPIKATYLCQSPNFVGVHNFAFIKKYDVLNGIVDGGTFLLNTAFTSAELNKMLPGSLKKIIKQKNIQFYTIDAVKKATEAGLKNKINTVMQSAFFAVTDVIDQTNARQKQKEFAYNSYNRKGQDVVNANYAAIDSGYDGLTKIDISTLDEIDYMPAPAIQKNEYFEKFIKPINELKGNLLPVSVFNASGCVPTSTSKYDKRGIAISAPQWIPENCIQCNMCAISCPHATIRPILQSEEALKDAPQGFIVKDAIGTDGLKYRMQINPKDCTGCGICANVCPARNKALIMKPILEIENQEQNNYEYSCKLPQNCNIFDKFTVKGSQFKQPLFEFSGACAGCGETPYIKLLTQLFGEKLIIANATGCSSIYGGSAPSCPYTCLPDGRGVAWSNSLFEDNAEYGYGIKKARQLTGEDSSIWIVGGDGWAYDIGYGGLDHVLASGENVNILVLDTEVYSNTGGQSSKSTPKGAVAKFAASGKTQNKKPLAEMAMQYGSVYVAQVSLGASFIQTIKAFKEAEEFNGPSLIIAYSPCINHGIDMTKASEMMKSAVNSGYFPLFRFNPALDSPLVVDNVGNTAIYNDFLLSQNRFKSLKNKNEQKANELFGSACVNAQNRINKLKNFTTLFNKISN